MDNLPDVDRLEDEVRRLLGGATEGTVTPEGVEAVRREWLSKEGRMKTLMRSLRDVPQEERAARAAVFNAVRERLETFVRDAQARFAGEDAARRLTEDYFDFTLPGRSPGLGDLHPITRVERTLSAVLRQCGFGTAPGPVVEEEYYCFDALNIPPHHPARDMQDTFYTESGHVLRTHTTSVQARLLARRELPVKAVSKGPVYRNEAEDATHTAMFHQFELVWVDKGLYLADLTGLVTFILKELYGKRRKVRFVPKFYPYTEPSLGAQVECGFCGGAGCPACGGSGWATVGGAGMVHRKVLEGFGFDPETVSGYAFGLGTSRLAAQLCGAADTRQVYDGDLRPRVAV